MIGERGGGGGLEVICSSTSIHLGGVGIFLVASGCAGHYLTFFPY